MRRTDFTRSEFERPQDAEEAGSKGGSIRENGGVDCPAPLPCRITAKFYGLEWFIYNRTPAYDSILAGFDPAGRDPAAHFGSASSESSLKGDEHAEPSLNDFPRSAAADDISMHHESADSEASQHQPAPQKLGESLSTLLQLLPLKLDCNKGAIVMGNENTRSVLTTTFDSAAGLIEACCAASPLDLYRQVFSIKFNHPVVQMRRNPDYKHTQLAAAQGLNTTREEQPGVKRKRDTIFNYQLQKRRVWHSLRDLIPYFQTSVESFHVSDNRAGAGPRSTADANRDLRWVGLSRYLEQGSQDDHSEWDAIEYGRFSNILDSPNMTVVYFWDIPGPVKVTSAAAGVSSSERSSDINGASPPEWGIDVKIDGGDINYGPWADRERVGLQNIFFPNAYRINQPADHLRPGESRQSSAFRLRVEFDQETTLRIPTREPSKDWQWKGRGDAVRGASKLKKPQRRKRNRGGEGEKGNVGPDIRPFGWFSLLIANNSTITYTMDMVAGKSGFASYLNIDFRDSKMSSSVNHALLWSCPEQLITCDLSVPLSWKALRTWRFDVQNKGMELFLLRDHIFLLTDLITDWGSGPSSDYYTFVPFVYHLNLSFDNIRLFTNVNDSNIVSDPTDLSDNRLLVVKGEQLTSDVTIPLDKYCAEQNAVDFDVTLRGADIDFVAPMWDTLHTFLKNKTTANLETLKIGGTYSYFLSTSPELTDTLLINLHGVSPKLYMFGFLIKSFMTVKENYFGEEVHFKTLEEYQDIAYSGDASTAHNGINPNKKTNDLDVVLHVTVDNPCVLLPENLYDDHNYMRLTAPSLDIDLRFTNYYMDMQFSLAPLKAALESHWREHHTMISDTQLFIGGVSVYGHRIFGLPPTEPTYVCNWDFDIGAIIGECSPQFLASLARALQSFDCSFDNEENALPPLFPTALYDVTFLRARVRSIHISVLLDKDALIIKCGTVSTNFNDWANARFSKRMSLVVPDLTIAAIDRTSVDNSDTLIAPDVLPTALFHAPIRMKMAQRRDDIVDSRRLQQDHVKSHDQRTQRTPWLLYDWDDIESGSQYPGQDVATKPTIAIPTMPEPLTRASAPLGLSTSETLQGGRNPRSFLLSSEKSSTRNKYKRGPGSMDGTPAIYQYQKRAGDTWDGLKTRGAFRNGKNVSQRASQNHWNAWSVPQFTLHRLQLDTSRLSLGQESDANLFEAIPAAPKFDPGISSFDGDNSTHTNFMIELPQGIRGICTPRLLFILSNLIESLEMRHPVEIIDSLQKDIMSDIIAYEKSLKRPKKATSFALRSPVVSVMLVNESGDSQVTFRDEYKIEASRLNTEFRARFERQKGDLIEGISKTITSHIAADRISLSVESLQPDQHRQKSEIGCVLSDMSFWIVTSPMIRSDVQIRAIDTVTSTKSVERLGHFVRRTTTMLDSATSSFKRSSLRRQKRMRFLIYSLTQSAAHMPDPAFLTRVSYMLRIASGHLRHHDSWKILSRIRNVYNNLSPQQKNELIKKCSSDDITSPPNAKSLVLSRFDQWRAWDLAHVEKSYVMRRIWDLPETVSPDASPMTCLSSTVKLFRFSIDPGSRESDFVMGDLSTVISSKSHPKSSENPMEKLLFLTTVESYCSSLRLRLRWELLDLVEGLANAMSTVTLESKVSDDSTESEAPVQRELQFVLGTDLGALTVDGINIKLALVGKALRSSVVLKPLDLHSHSASLLISSGITLLDVFNLSKVMMQWKFTDPHIYCSRVTDKQSEIKHDWKVAVSSRKLKFDMNEDPLSLVDTADRLIDDEVQYIRKLIKDLDLPSSNGKLKKDKPTRSTLQVATFLDDYRLRFCILPSLTYCISGQVARASIISKFEKKLEIDFDLKQNRHAFLSDDGGDWQALSEIGMPPINGRIITNALPSRTEMEFDVTVELIELEASAARSLLSVLARPEFSHLVSDLKQSVESLKLHSREVLGFDSAPAQEKDVSNSTFLYKARTTMAGTKIHATAPGLNGKSYSADMVFSIGLIRMRVSNGIESGHPTVFPDFQVDTSRIGFDLSKKDTFRARSYCSIAVDAKVKGTSATDENRKTLQAFDLSSENFNIELYPEAAALIVDVAVHLQERMKTLDLSHEVKRLKRLRHRVHFQTRPKPPEIPEIQTPNDGAHGDELFGAIFSLGLNNIQVVWNMTAFSQESSGRKSDDLVFSIQRVNLSNKKTTSAKLRIENVQLQMVPPSGDKRKRTLNSALLPELVFNVACSSTAEDLRIALQAAGKSLDIRATSDFVLPGNMIKRSIASAVKTIRDANSVIGSKPSDGNSKERSLFGNKRLRSVLVDIDFAGAVVSLQGKQSKDHKPSLRSSLKGSRASESKYRQYDAASTATLRAPGVALKVQFEENAAENSTLNAELKIDASSNVLYPSIVPLIRQMSGTVKDVMGEQTKQTKPRRSSNAMMLQSQSLMQETPLDGNDPTSMLQRCKLNLGVLICKQEFSLSCQPITRVAATAGFGSVYAAVNTIQSEGDDRFLALSVSFNDFGASVKHVYSNESTASFEVNSIVMSLMNSRHLGKSKGISAALRVSPMQVMLNVRQVQDLLLFREIWVPANESLDSNTQLEPQPTDTQAYIVQRYQQVASAPAFPWNTTIAIEKIAIQLDMGSTLGKAQFAIDDLWLSSRKTSVREQVLCIGLKSVGIDSKGRLSGLAEFQTIRVRTSINWPDATAEAKTPLIQASVSFDELQVKVSFDYQPFLIAHISIFEFLMYNVGGSPDESNERLFSILDGSQVQVFCTTLTASQSLALFQAWQRLMQDKQAAYEASLREIEKYLRRKGSAHSENRSELSASKAIKKPEGKSELAPISLQTGVVVTIHAVHIGVFPSTFFDSNVFKLEAREAQARFDASLDKGKIHSALGLTLGQLRVALSPIARSDPVAVEQLQVNETAARVIETRGGTILKVPRVVAGMETWQGPGSSQIEFLFRSSFEGKVDVGWNYARISFIRDMWDAHSRALASRLGKPLPPSAVRITGGLNAENGSEQNEHQEKITAVVNVPQSRYNYVAMEPPVIETPQLRDMGEATPPLEWIGLQRDKLPNVTHQIIIVTLLEVAKEVEDAYAKILWSS